MRSSEPKQAQRGSVMIEATIVIASITLMLGLILAVHRAGLVRIQAFERARGEAWASAMHGCPSEGFGLGDLIRGLAHGDLPLPDSLLPTHASTFSTERTKDSAGITFQIPCTGGGHADNDAGDWIYDLFH